MAAPVLMHRLSYVARGWRSTLTSSSEGGMFRGASIGRAGRAVSREGGAQCGQTAGSGFHLVLRRNYCSNGAEKGSKNAGTTLLEQVRTRLRQTTTSVSTSISKSHSSIGETILRASSLGARTSALSPQNIRKAVSLRLEAFYKDNYVYLLALVGVGGCLLLWRLLCGTASLFVNISEGLAELGFFALAASATIFAYLYVRSLHALQPDALYRLAMNRLNHDPRVLEVLGAPLAGTELRAYVMSGGRLRVKNMVPKWSSKRCHVIFPLQGSRNRGIVSVEAKKSKGEYVFKLLSVDVPTGRDDHRIFLAGDQARYEKGSIVSELRDPFLKTAEMENFHEEEEEEEDEEEEHERRLRIQEAMPKKLSEGGGMYSWERAYETVASFFRQK